MTAVYDHGVHLQNVTSFPENTNGSSFGFHPDLQVTAESVIPIILQRISHDCLCFIYSLNKLRKGDKMRVFKIINIGA